MAFRTPSLSRLGTLTLAVVVLVVGAISIARRAGAERPEIGVRWGQTDRGPIALEVLPDGAAARAGLEPGDLLLAVDGRPTASALDAGQLAWGSEGAESIVLVVERGGVDVGLSLQPTWVPFSDIYAYLAIVGLAFWLSGIFIALRWPTIRGGAIYPLLALDLFVLLVFSHTGRADTLDRLIYFADVVAAALAPALLVHLCAILARRLGAWRRYWVWGVYALSAGMLLLDGVLHPSGLAGAYRFARPLFVLETRDRLEPIALALGLAISIVLLLRSYRGATSAAHRGQIRWVLWGLAVGLGPGVAFYLLPWALGAPDLPSWAVFVALAPLLFVPAALTAALARYRLHDLDVLLIRGISEVAALLATAATYSATIFLLRELLGELLPMSRSATRYLGFFVAALAYARLRSLTRAGVERLFYRKRYSYRATLLDWAREMNSETDLMSILRGLRDRIRDTLGVPTAQVLVRRGPRHYESVEPDRLVGRLELDEAAMSRLDREPSIALDDGQLAAVPWARYLFALKVKGSVRAILAISDRQPPEEPLSSEDRSLLATLAAHAASAIETARLMLEVRQRVDEVEELHEREAHILENAAVGLLMLDEDGRVRSWNRALERIYGAARDEAIGRRLADLFPLHVVQQIEREERGGEPESRLYRVRMVNRLGREIVVNLTLSPRSDVSSGASRVVTVDDVTDQVTLEEQVRQQERLASLGLLAAGVAHEINTPLTGVSSYAQMLRERLDHDDPRRAMLDKIEAQTHRASEITRSLLDLSRPERSVLQELDLNETIRELLQLFGPQVKGRATRLELALADELPRIRGHRVRLQQVLLNLLINAREAVGDEGTIEVATTECDGAVQIEIADDGPGIPAADLPRIFDPFFTTKTRGKGTGLGLSICYGIVREHDGEIFVDSREGDGTRFRIVLPAAASARVAGS